MTINKTIAIVGGGPGGLTLARLLQIAGFEVKVYERDLNKDERIQGGTLDLHEDSGLKALKKANLMDAFIENYRHGADKMRVLDNFANIHYDQHLETRVENFGDENFRPEIDRGTLRDILLESLKPDTIVWDKQVVSILENQNSWQINFKDGTTSVADILIGADGGNSKIRPIVTQSNPIYSGITIIEGSIYNSEKNCPEIHKILKDGKIFAFGNEQSIIVSSKGDGSMSFYTGCKTDEFWFRNCGIDFKNKEQVLNWFKKDFAEWNIIWQELFINDKTTFIPRPQYYMPLDQTWETKPNITIIGDAAHLMPPYAGEGVNMAMLDALELSECLINENFKDINLAIGQYEQQMRKRATEITKMTLEQTESLHSTNALKIILEMFGEQQA
ncbi:MAG: FAD-dependent oxidoreductase [Bacteroidia bacterium]